MAAVILVRAVVGGMGKRIGEGAGEGAREGALAGAGVCVCVCVEQQVGVEMGETQVWEESGRSPLPHLEWAG